jgi:hypothetical protein
LPTRSDAGQPFGQARRVRVRIIGASRRRRLRGSRAGLVTGEAEAVRNAIPWLVERHDIRLQFSQCQRLFPGDWLAVQPVHAIREGQHARFPRHDRDRRTHDFHRQRTRHVSRHRPRREAQHRRHCRALDRACRSRRRIRLARDLTAIPGDRNLRRGTAPRRGDRGQPCPLLAQRFSLCRPSS